MSNWSTIDELRNIFIEKYTNSRLSNELEKACSEEYELMRDYNGRQILELLQNVDDAYGDKKKDKNLDKNEEVEVTITYRDNILEVGNTGTSFTKETIERLCLGRASNKSSKNIGNKGTGFRSLLNDAEWIELYSGDFSIRFSEDFAKNCFEKHSHIGLINEQLMSWKKDYPLCFPIMNCPEQIEMVASEFDTLIRVKLKERNQVKESGVTKQLTQPFYKSLLFLPNITKITIASNQEIRIAEKLADGIEVLIEKTVNGMSEPAEEYFVFEKDFEIDDKTAVLSIAVPKDSNYDFKKEKLHCYFPIRNFPTPINALIHAPFITNNSRDDVPNDTEEINKKIFDKVLPFIKCVAETLAKPEYADTAIKMVTPIQDNKLWDSDFFNFHDKYLDLLSNAKILPTVNGEYISIQDDPKLLTSPFPAEFKGEEFNYLLQLSKVEHVELVSLLSEFVDYDGLNFSAEDLARKINVIQDKWGIPTRINVFLWWSAYFDDDIVPNLLMDGRDNWIQKSDKVFLPTDGGISVLPNELGWVKLCVLDKDYVDELISQIKGNYSEEWKKLNEKFSAERTGDKRLLDTFSKQYLAIEFTEQSSSDLIISTINRQIDHQDKAKSFMNWFFENYRDKLTQGSELSKVPFNLPNANGEIYPSTKLFLGENYGNPLGDKLFANTTYSALMEPNKLYQGSDIDGFTDFIETCGVAKFPLVEPKLLTKNDGFKSFIADKYSDEIDFNINYLTSMSIENIENLISTLDTSDIVEWVRIDEDLRELLYSNRKESNAKQQTNWNGLYFNSNEYIKYVLNITPWIQFNGHKYSPQQIVKYEKLKANIKDLYGVSEHDLLELVGNDLIQNLDFKDSMAHLNDADIKRILDELPTFDKGEISRKLYTEIIKFKKDKEPAYSPEDILVLAKDGKFYRVHDVKYADKKIPKAMENQEHFIAIPVKQNISTINKWLGVDRFRTQLELFSFIKVDYSLENFKQEIDTIKTAVLSTIDDNKANVDKIKRIQIIPCNEIVAIDKEQDNRQIQLEDFYFVDDGRDFYLKLPSGLKPSIDQLRLLDGFSNSIVDIFKQLLTLELDPNLLELLVSKDATRKREKISDEYGVDRWNESYELLFSENALNKMVIDYFSENGASSNTLTQIEDVDFSYLLRDSDYAIVISSLKDINKDISDFNTLSELINIDVREYWQKIVRRYLDEHEQEFADKLFSKLVSSGDIEKQNRFLVELNEYKYFTANPERIKNSVTFDLAQAVYEFFPVLMDNVEKKDIRTIYKENYDELNPDNLFADEIANNQKAQIMIYFQRKDEFKNWLLLQQQKVEKEQAEKSIDPYKQLLGVVPEKQEIEYHETKRLPSTNGKRHSGAYTKSAEEKANHAKKIVGNKGELVIYNLLCEQYGKENVFPKSEAFVEIDILKPGQASSGEYDLSYKDEHGKTFFVEVKTGDGNSFIITPGELEFAKQNPDQFKLYLVSEIDSSEPKYKEMPPRFWEDDKFRLKKVIERIDVEF